MRNDRRAWIRATLWIGLAGAALLLWYDLTGSIRVAPAGGAPGASALTLRDLQGRELELADYRGQVVVLNLWASWCGPCRIEIPRLARLERDFGGDGLAVLGVNTEELSADQLAKVARELQIDYTVLVPGGPFQGTFADTRVIPQTWLIDRQGRVRADHSGLVTERSLRRACRKLLEEEG